MQVVYCYTQVFAPIGAATYQPRAELPRRQPRSAALGYKSPQVQALKGRYNLESNDNAQIPSQEPIHVVYEHRDPWLPENVRDRLFAYHTLVIERTLQTLGKALLSSETG